MANDTHAVGYPGDPLSEPTRQARLQAAVRKRGLTVQEFARRLGVRWQTAQQWFAGSPPGLDLFTSACELVGYSMVDITYGYERPRHPRVLTTEEIKRVFAELATPAELRAAFARHQDSPEGRYQEYSRAYVCGWLDAFGDAIRNGATQQRAHELAAMEALRAHALAVAVVAQVQPVDVSDLAQAVAARSPAPRRRRRVTEPPAATRRVAR